MPLFSFLYLQNLGGPGGGGMAHALLSPLLPAPLSIGVGTIFKKCEILKAVFFV